MASICSHPCNFKRSCQAISWPWLMTLCLTTAPRVMRIMNETFEVVINVQSWIKIRKQKRNYTDMLTHLTAVYNIVHWLDQLKRYSKGCDPRQSCVLVTRLYFSFCSDILGVAHAVLHQSIPCLLGIMISKSVLVGEAVLASILWVCLSKMSTEFGHSVGL